MIFVKNTCNLFKISSSENTIYFSKRLFSGICGKKCDLVTRNNTLYLPHKYFKTNRKSISRPGNLNFDGIKVEQQPTNMKLLMKPFIFTLMFSTGSIVGASLWQYENMRSRASMLFKKPGDWFHHSHKKMGKWRQDINTWWRSLREDQRLFIPIFLLNGIVFLAWRVPRFQPFMIKYFCSNPAAKVLCWPMILSTFSHYSTFHLLANMYVLYTFSSGIISQMGKEQFIAMYLSGGVISSFSSYMHKILSSQASRSLGASGAIMGVLGFVCTEYPDTRLSIIFLPMYTFSAEMGLKFVIGLDTLGILMGWKFFDHAAHLGGALWGIFWCHWGSTHIWQNRDMFLKYWHEFRSGPSSR